MNPLDRVIGFFDPARFERRIAARKRAEVLMHYDAAARTPRTADWRAPGTSADAAAFGNRALLRQRSREMVRNRAMAARARDVVVVNVVGDGIVPSVKAADDTTKAAVKGLVDRHLMTPDLDSMGECDLFDMQSMVMAAVFTDGEVLVRRRIRDTRLNPALKLPFQVEILEADHLDTSVLSWGQNMVVEGIEYGPTGGIEAYHLFNEHPGAAMHRRTLKSVRVPWQDVLHIRRFDRPGQTRGVPWLAPVMLTLADISDYHEAQIMQQRMATLLAVMIEWPVGGRPPDDKSSGLESLAPGAVVSLPEGAEAKILTPPTMAGFAEFMDIATGAVATGIGITRESLSGNLRGVNYSSGRMGRMEMDRLVRQWQRRLIIGQFCRGVARWMREAMALIPAYGGLIFDLDWTPPRRILVDPTKEIPAMIGEMDAGLSSRQRQQRELGYDPDTIRRERVEDMERDRAAGLPPPAASAAPPEPAAPGANPEEDDNADGK